MIAPLGKIPKGPSDDESVMKELYAIVRALATTVEARDYEHVKALKKIFFDWEKKLSLRSRQTKYVQDRLPAYERFIESCLCAMQGIPDEEAARADAIRRFQQLRAV
jgi:hypothetical protein